MRIFKTDSEGLSEAAEEIRAGRLVAFATETVYGLGADATNDHAVAAIYEAKGRPSFNPLIIHVPSLEKAKEYVKFNEIDAGMDAAKKAEMVERSGGGRTFPQIFIGETHIGGCDDMMALERAGKLDSLLEA